MLSVLERDLRLTIRKIVSCTGISEANMHTILNKCVYLKKGCHLVYSRFAQRGMKEAMP
jgi:hypothetical protein